MITVSRRSFLAGSGGAAVAPFIRKKASAAQQRSPDVIYHNGKIVTVDRAFSIAQAAAVAGDRIAAVGPDGDVLALAGRDTEMVDLGGRMMVPGLIEGHAHPERASLSESDGPLPNPRTVGECLDWLRREAARRPDGEWIVHPKLFPTRLRELRSPTLAELDAASPTNPVFLNASYGGAINSAAMRACGITEETRHEGLLRDPATGALNGRLINTAFGLLKIPAGATHTEAERIDALEGMFRRYNRVGFTGLTSGGLSPGALDIYHAMRAGGRLTIRVAANIFVRFPFRDRSADEIAGSIAAYGMKTGDGDEWLRIAALKTTVDGGILTGTAYLREPWGERAAEVFGITEPGYRGNVRMTAGDFARFVRAAASAGWKTTAHCTGGGGVDLMLDGYEAVHRERDIRPRRCSIIQGNFCTLKACRRAAGLGVIADMQPAWFYKDADAMLDILGGERIRTFHPYRTMIGAGVVVGAGSDHMVILDDRESINPYNPWLAMWSMVTRKTERGAVIVPDEALTREQALRCYTINNAFSTFEESLKGSIEPGKLADMVVLDRDFLDCPADGIRDVRVEMTVVGGKVVYGG